MELYQQLASLCFFALMMGILSLWLGRNPWIYGSFFILSFFLGLFANVVTPLALLPLGALFVMHGFLKAGVKGLLRALLVLLATVLSITLWMHLLPGFHNLKISDSFVQSPGAYPYSFYLNWDKPFTGIFILAWAFPLLKTKEEFKRIAFVTLPYTVCAILIILLFAIWGNVVKWDPKMPAYFWLWAIANLFLVVVPEEAVMRGFVQKEFFDWFGSKGIWANVGSVTATSLLFALLHITFVPSATFILLVFVAGLLYGAIYQYTKAIESAIFCHFALNIVHMLFFTYPALK
ncbi:MAG TPA: CPBP family intramembrane glutamic endopeptidase [Rhabdochlamydiaceae bacterium]|nr:CPBP family intramembrane glutamic endopeptidase [Rhabdochlamydiaceae bacterium]